MNADVVDNIARAVLYEGYILYPYRPSVKNRLRWTFGGIYPKAYSEAQNGAEPFVMQTQCLITGSANSVVEVGVRFLHLMNRTVGHLSQPVVEWNNGTEPSFTPAESLQIGHKQYHSWQEAMERDLPMGQYKVDELLHHPQQKTFNFRPIRKTEPLRDSAGLIVGMLIREQQSIDGKVEISASHVSDGLFRLTVRIENHTSIEAGSRDAALLRSFVSTHTRLGITNGQYVSLTDPPPAFAQAAAACQNIGCWPILVGNEGDTSAMLSSPIILSDYPQIAPESPGDLFDGGEIDEILTLRILTLTDEEKRQMASIDQRAGEMLARTESLAREQLFAMHGVMRTLEQSHVR